MDNNSLCAVLLASKLWSTVYITFASGEAEVQIQVTDMNDNVPYFKDRLYTVQVPENTDPGTVIISVTAEDKDEGKTI